MERPTVALLFGGRSNEYEVSCRSAAFVYRALISAGFPVLPIGISRSGVFSLYQGNISEIESAVWEECPSLSRVRFLTGGAPRAEDGGLLTPDVIFPAVHGQYAEDGRLQGFLDTVGIPYVGCGCECSVLAWNKILSKQIARDAGVPTLPFVAVRRGEEPGKVAERLSFPVFVKPACSGSSVGASVVKSKADLPAALALAWEVDPVALVEPLFSGKEVEVAVLDDGNLTVSCPGEIAPGAPFYDYDTKYKTDTASCYIPARIPRDTSDAVRAYAATLFRAFGCRHLSRVDFFVSDGGIFFNEINTMPGFTSISMYPSLLAAEGISLPALVTRLVEAALR